MKTYITMQDAHNEQQELNSMDLEFMPKNVTHISLESDESFVTWWLAFRGLGHKHFGAVKQSDIDEIWEKIANKGHDAADMREAEQEIRIALSQS